MKTRRGWPRKRAHPPEAHPDPQNLHIETIHHLLMLANHYQATNERRLAFYLRRRAEAILSLTNVDPCESGA